MRDVVRVGPCVCPFSNIIYTDRMRCARVATYASTRRPIRAHITLKNDLL